MKKLQEVDGYEIDEICSSFLTDKKINYMKDVHKLLKMKLFQGVVEKTLIQMRSY